MKIIAKHDQDLQKKKKEKKRTIKDGSDKWIYLCTSQTPSYNKNIMITENKNITQLAKQNQNQTHIPEVKYA